MSTLSRIRSHEESGEQTLPPELLSEVVDGDAMLCGIRAKPLGGESHDLTLDGFAALVGHASMSQNSKHSRNLLKTMSSSWLTIDGWREQRVLAGHELVARCFGSARG